MRASTLILWSLLMAWSANAWQAQAGEIGFLEDFALAADRTVALKQLVPGSEDYYYYHALHYQNTEQFEKVDSLLPAWTQRHGHTQRVREITHRQMLLTYEKNAEKSRNYLIQVLNLRFDHQAEIPGAKPNLPTSLDAKLISRENLLQREYAHHGALEGMEDAAFEWLIAKELSPDRRRQLLARLARPDYAGLPKLVADDLNHPQSGGFGSLNIHRSLLLTQLEELLKIKPDLLDQTNFVQTYLTKLRPHADSNWREDFVELEAYLQRLQAFVDRLAPAHNSLKAHVLYHRLVLARKQGKPDKALFLAYIQLPRVMPYVNAKYLETPAGLNFRCDLNSDFNPFTSLPTIGNDEPLVRAYLAHFFLEAANTKEFEPWLNDVYLKHLFAETKIVHGLGDAEQWYSLLPPEMFQQLKQRVDLEFAATNQTNFRADEPVSLDVEVKNVGTLLVKVYEINSRNYFRKHLEEINTAVNLDGLVANEELTFKYTEPPLRRVRRHFELKSLQKPGVYVVDFIGNGRNSRALIRKGKLDFTVQTSAAGHLFTIYDEANRPVPKAGLWMAGRDYQADEAGTVSVPFSTAPGEQRIILSRGDFCSLATFHHQAEQYTLEAGFYVDRESLLPRKKASVLIRPQLALNGVPVPLKLLEDVKLVITSVDQAGISSTKEVPDLQFALDRETTYEFMVPSRLARIAFELRAKVKNLSLGNSTNLSTSEAFELNQIDLTDKIEDLHLGCYAGNYVLHLLGKTGEPKSNRVVRVSLKHRDFRQTVDLSLQTSATGRIDLGTLSDIASMTVSCTEGTSHTWNLPRDYATVTSAVSARAGETFKVEYFGTLEQTERSELSLLELREGTYFADRFEALKLVDGLIAVGPLTAGDYELLYKATGQRVQIRVAGGEVGNGYVHGTVRRLELPALQPVGVRDLDVSDKEVGIAITNATPLTRVHVIATRFLPAFSALNQFARVQGEYPAIYTKFAPESIFLSSRDIGDEYRYILDRRLAPRHPGNMLNRPGLLLNPWALRSTETSSQQALRGEGLAAFGGRAASAPSAKPTADQAGSGNTDFSNLDFFAEPAVVLANLTPDKDGIVKFERTALKNRQHLQIFVLGPDSTLVHHLTLAEDKIPVLDLRLAKGLDGKTHLTQQKQTTFVDAGGKLHLPDVSGSRFEVYDSLQKVYSLFATLSHNSTLAEFNFITRWPKLSREEKQTFYSKYACHELNFFLAKKDPEFYREVVQPYLPNKKDQTFLDRWLIDQDVSSALQPWPYERLNIVERILLGQRLKNERPFATRHVQDLFALLPPDIERQNLLFGTAIRASGLATGEEEQLGALMEKAGEGKGQNANGMLAMDAIQAPQAMAPPPASPGKPGADKNRFGASKKSAEAVDRQMHLKRALVQDAKEELKKADESAKFREDRDGDALERRKQLEELFRQIERTQEYAENNYYHLPIQQHVADLVTVNGFWRDYAESDPTQPFRSAKFPEASRNFTEMMFALSVLDLPFEAKPHDVKFEGVAMNFTAGSPAIVFHEEIKSAGEKKNDSPILVSQNFFQANDRQRVVENETVDKFVTDEFIIHTVYGCQVVVTNPTSSRQRLDALLQIPVGALSVSNGQATKTISLDLQPFGTQTVEYFFYFPRAGKFTHYPIHVSKNATLVAFAEPREMNVVEEPTRVDRESWEYVSQQGSNEEVLDYLRTKNLYRVNLDRIAFRMADAKFFEQATSLLAARHHYNHTLWSYGVKHGAVARMDDFLQHADGFVNESGNEINSRVLKVNPVARFAYQHLEYMPLVNARAHQLGQRRQIVNDRFFAQYHELLAVLSRHRELSQDDLLAITYYLLLQDRVEEATATFARVNAATVATKLQYDYCAAYLDMFQNEPKLAPVIANKYAKYPVDRWRNAFAAVASQLEEVSGAKGRVIDPENREQRQAELAAKQAVYDFRVEGRTLLLNHRNLDRVTINYYVMDIEFLFSRNPFVQEFSGEFALIRPNLSQVQQLDGAASLTKIPLPETFANRNVLVEIVAGGQTKAQAAYAHSLQVQLAENYGEARVELLSSGKPLPKTYVKVYAQMRDGSVKFYKDGYTDLRGKFDYTSLSTNDLDNVQKFSLLIMHDEHGAIIREALPPKR